MGLFSNPYTIKDGNICLKAIKIFNIAQNIWKNIVIDASIFIIIKINFVEAKIRDDVIIELNSGGNTNFVILNLILEEIISEKCSIKQKILQKLNIESIITNKNLTEYKEIKYYESILKITFMYYRSKNKIIDWSTFFPGIFLSF